LFRSDAQGEILARLLLNPDRAFTIADLARMTDTSYASAHREVQRLIRAGVATERRVGRHHQLVADTASPAYKPLCELLLLTYGPATVVPRVLASIGGIREAYIYGSWAARRMGEPGSPPGDIDVLVVGDPPRRVLYEAAEEAERALGREVNIRAVSPTVWAEAADPFVRTLKSRPLVRLRVEEESS
jgi:predicted nucleotidyltransferase